MTKFDPKSIQWDDDDSFDEQDQSSQQSQDQSFEAMLAGQTDEVDDEEFDIGDNATGTVVAIGKSSGEIMIDLGGKLTGVLSLAEWDDDRQLPAVGDSVTAIVTDIRGDEVTLSKKLAAAAATLANLEAAAANKMPVRGKVTGANKGGFDVQIPGRKAFCPVSKIDTKFVEDKSAYINKEFDFLIEKIAGRDVVVNRAALLKEQQAAAAAEMLEEWEGNKDREYTARVSSLKPFGAIVEVGALEGLVHVSELSHGHVSDPAEIVAVGDAVRVRLLKVEQQGDRQRLSFSVKAAQSSPWDDVDDIAVPGKSITGKVRRLAEFGAFVELAPGLEGLVHVSEMSWTKRVRHPKELVSDGDTVTVRVISVDRDQQRISLSLKDADADPWRATETQYRPGTTVAGKVEAMKSFGALVELQAGLSGLVPISTIKAAFGEAYRKATAPGSALEVTVIAVEPEQRKILLGLPQVEAEDSAADDYAAYLQQQEQAAGTATSGGLGTLGEALQASFGKGGKRD